MDDEKLRGRPKGDATSAIGPLRDAQHVWQGVGAPYLSARIRFLVARAFQALGDEDGAALELDAANCRHARRSLRVS
jgi:hypothetical protein